MFWKQNAQQQWITQKHLEIYKLIQSCDIIIDKNIVKNI